MSRFFIVISREAVTALRISGREAEIALYQAVLSYDTAQSSVTFGLYAGICLKNRIISLLREEARAGRDKPISLTELGGSSVEAPMMPDPMESIVSAENCRLLIDRIRRELTSYESLVLSLYLGGCNAAEIAARTGRNKNLSRTRSAAYAVR